MIAFVLYINIKDLIEYINAEKKYGKVEGKQVEIIKDYNCFTPLLNNYAYYLVIEKRVGIKFIRRRVKIKDKEYDKYSIGQKIS